MKHREKKRGGCLTKLARTFVLLVFLLVFVASITDQETTTSTPDAAPQETCTPSPTATPRPTPDTPEGWVTQVVKDEYKDDFISVEFEVVDPNRKMITINCVFAGNLTTSLRRDMFMFHAKDIFRELTEMRADGIVDFDLVFIHGKTTFVDKYGRESEGDAMQICMAAKDLEHIVWENMRIDMLPEIATTYMVHPIFRD